MTMGIARPQQEGVGYPWRLPTYARQRETRSYLVLLGGSMQDHDQIYDIPVKTIQCSPSSNRVCKELHKLVG